MVYSSYKKQRILYCYSQGLKAPTIAKLLQQEHLPCTRVCVHKFLNKFEETGNLHRRSGSGRPSKITAEVKLIVEQRMQEDDETTAHQLHSPSQRSWQNLKEEHLSDFTCIKYHSKFLSSTKHLLVSIPF